MLLEYRRNYYIKFDSFMSFSFIEMRLLLKISLFTIITPYHNTEQYITNTSIHILKSIAILVVTFVFSLPRTMQMKQARYVLE